MSLRQSKAILLVLSGGGLLAAGVACAADKVTFDADVKPIFRQHCAGCHNQDDPSSDLALDSYGAAIAGGAGGESLAAGDPSGSRLWLLITGAEEPVMPPGGDKLPANQLAVVRAWIEGGLLENKDSKPKASSKPAIAAVEAGPVEKPDDPAMPTTAFRQPVLTAPTPGPIDSLAASPWASVVAVPWQRQASLYDTESGQLLGVAPFLDGSPRVVRFSRDGELLLVAGGRDAAYGAAALYDVRSGARLATIGDEVDAVLAADVLAGNQVVAIGGSNKKVRAYRVGQSDPLYTCEKHTDWITSLAYSPDGGLLATADRAGGLRLWQATAGHERADLRGHTAAVTAVAWRRDGGLLASASEDGTLRLWGPTGAAIKSINAHGGGVLAVAFAPDGRLATTGRDRRVKLWKPDGADAGELAQLDDIGLAVAFTHDGARVVAADWTGAVRLIDVASKETVARLAPNPPTLEARLAAAEVGYAQQQSAQSAAVAALAEAEKAIESAEQQHAAHDARIAEAELALADVKATLDEARERLATAEAAGATSLVEPAAVEEPSPDEQTPEEPPAEAKESAPASESSAPDGVALDELKASLAAASTQHADAEKRLAKVANESAGLPDLEQLQAKAAASRSAAEQAGAALKAAEAARQGAADELAAYQAAPERLAGELAGFAGALSAAAESEQAAAAAEAAVAQRAAEADRRVAELREEVKRLRESLRAASVEQSAAAEELESASTQLAESRAALATATRQQRQAESQIETVQAADDFRRERAAEE